MKISFKGFTPEQKQKYFRLKDTPEQKQFIEATVEAYDKFLKKPGTLEMLDGDSLELSRISPKGYKGVNWAITLTDKSGKSIQPWEICNMPMDNKTIKSLVKSTLIYVGLIKYKTRSSIATLKEMTKRFYK